MQFILVHLDFKAKSELAAVWLVRYAMRVFVVSDGFKLSFSGFWSILHLTHLPVLIGFGR